MADLEVIATAPLPALQPCEPKHFNQCIAVLDASLPRRGSDEASGKLMLKTYQRKLGHMPREQIDYLANEVVERCRWFPSIAECLDIAREWRRQDAAQRERARLLIEHEDNARLADIRTRLRFGQITQAEVDALPESWRDNLAGSGHLHRDPDRRYEIMTPWPMPPAIEDQGHDGEEIARG